MRLSEEDLRLRTLARQLPNATDVLDLFERLAPIQSQVPRSPFVLASSRRPGTTYAEVNDLLESHVLVKGTCLRGTVHTAPATLWPDLDAVARRTRENDLRRELGLSRLTVDDVTAEVERVCSGRFVPRDEVVEAVFAFVEAGEGRPVVDTPYVRNLVWGHPGLVRRPRDERWDKRTDAFHRTASELLGAGPPDADAALDRLVLRHVATCGPVTRRDLAYFLGDGLRRVDAAVARLGDALERLEGPGDEPYLDLAEPPGGDAPDDVRLLPEFDALVVGYAGPGRTRFLRAEQLDAVWGRANGIYSPTVLADGRMVATWRVTGAARATRLEVVMLPGERPLTDDELDEPARALGSVLDVTVADVSVARP
ncbi:crosslink repair DNA glycosylase YcaQ family protein [Aeromicrobium sp. IC_218]|uniref:DNA glycosylase AlkZ-like family protein n=1 Tax=Aeromicrobium sp. IC_218 TaxID=2545468 RepID=UPI00103A7B8E|nr:crosslink repair DNA glycosylase YcaQ family protein [Aeromicrobium sp. IC_218]TCI98854.1 hypothetical protein E0W78_08860 [Aeromicrobium sp. IC_218]